MANSRDRWVARPNCPGLWERRVRFLRVPLVKVVVLLDMGVPVWASWEHPYDLNEFDYFGEQFIEYRLLRRFQ